MKLSHLFVCAVLIYERILEKRRRKNTQYCEHLRLKLLYKFFNNYFQWSCVRIVSEGLLEFVTHCNYTCMIWEEAIKLFCGQKKSAAWDSVVWSTKLRPLKLHTTRNFALISGWTANSCSRVNHMILNILYCRINRKVKRGKSTFLVNHQFCCQICIVIQF